MWRSFILSLWLYQIVLVSVAVVVLFFISWAPFHVQRLGYVYFRHSYLYRIINEYLMYLSGCFYYLSVTLNPILYNLMSTKYRLAFKSVICCSAPRPDAILVRTTAQIHNYLRERLGMVGMVGEVGRSRTSTMDNNSRSRTNTLELSTRHI